MISARPGGLFMARPRKLASRLVCDESVTRLSLVPLLTPGLSRSISVVHKPSAPPAISICVWNVRDAVVSLYFREHGRGGDEIAILEDGIAICRDPKLAERRTIGEVAMGDEIRCLVWARAASTGPCLYLGRVRRSDGEHIGQPTRIGGIELEALSEACAVLRARTARGAA